MHLDPNSKMQCTAFFARRFRLTYCSGDLVMTVYGGEVNMVLSRYRHDRSITAYVAIIMSVTKLQNYCHFSLPSVIFAPVQCSSHAS